MQRPCQCTSLRRGVRVVRGGARRRRISGARVCFSDISEMRPAGAAFALHSRFDVVRRDRRRWSFIEQACRKRQPWIFRSTCSRHFAETAGSFSVEAATEVRWHRARVPFSCSRRFRSIHRRQRSRDSSTSIHLRASCVPHGQLSRSRSRNTKAGPPWSSSIVVAHGGRLWAMANEPRGAVFQLALPTIASATSK